MYMQWKMLFLSIFLIALPASVSFLFGCRIKCTYMYSHIHIHNMQIYESSEKEVRKDIFEWTSQICAAHTLSFLPFSSICSIYCCVKFDARANALHARIRWKTRAIWKCKEMLTRQMIYSIGAAPIHNARGCDLFYPLRATDAKSIHTAAVPPRRPFMHTICASAIWWLESWVSTRRVYSKPFSMCVCPRV